MNGSTGMSISGLSKLYGDFRALDSIDLTIGAGEFMTLLGPSGSGKTTLLMTLAGFTRPTRGHIQIAGRDLAAVPPHKRNFGMVFQHYSLFPHLNVAENVAYPLRMRRMSRADTEERVAHALDLVQLRHLSDQRIGNLSGGQKQRIALARAIVFEPDVLLMDEPLSALDKNLREQMQFEIRSLHDRLGITTVYVTHDQREALTMSDRIAVINRGRIAQLGTPTDLYNRPADSFVAEFLGESTLLPVDRTGEGYSLSGQPLRHDHAAPDASYLMVRPEKLEFWEPELEPTHNRCTGTVEQKVFQGDSLQIRIRLASGQQIVMRRSARRTVLDRIGEGGADIALALHAEDTVLVPDGAA